MRALKSPDQQGFGLRFGSDVARGPQKRGMGVHGVGTNLDGRLHARRQHDAREGGIDGPLCFVLWLLGPHEMRSVVTVLRAIPRPYRCETNVLKLHRS